ncbi:splicing factor 1-like isoform X1 [Pecten maximus]|uniref:splicing factor 1-like isoform X1 n=2 Tax=Pecten maximus TaxID=6579 RepID=UPI00145842FC|nr:splicing factor 1-like isoform X1 [Pecten maximus]
MFTPQGKRPSDMASGGWSNGAGSGESDRKKKRKSRWATDTEVDKTVIPGMPTVIPTGMSTIQEKQYLLHLQIEEISRRLRTGDLGIPPNPEDRSPSPEPIYNNEGKRLNTREYRTRKKLEEERHKLVQEAMDLNDEYKPPADYKPPVIRVNDKVMIPQEENPEINFVGLLIGPRGNTLKNLEKETGAKIIIRGKGSVKEGKIGRKDGQPLPGEDEPLHAYVTANNPENVKKAVEKIKEIITQGIEVPEGQNDLRRQQLRELALLNGTLRENDGLAKLKQLQQAQTIITNTIICSVCGGTGHIAQDCKAKRPGDTLRITTPTPAINQVDKAKMDSEYMSLMAELGEGPPPSQQKPTPHPAQPFRPQMSHPPPNPMGVNPPWQQNTMQRPGPPSMMRMNQHPTSQQNQPPMQQQQQQFMHRQPPAGMGMPMGSMPPTQMQPPPSQMPAPVGPPPPSQFNSSAGPVPPPWQQSVTAVPTPSSSNTTAVMGVPPPSLLSAPPPPPPSSQPPNSMSWMQPPQNAGVPPPPPVTSAGTPSPWGTTAPPPPPSQLAPWQQQAGHAPNPVAPPPPPPSQPGGYNPIPPPPPPGGFDMNNLGGLNQMLVNPPPPPPN